LVLTSFTVECAHDLKHFGRSDEAGEAGVTDKTKLRLTFGVLWLLAIAAILFARNGRFGNNRVHVEWAFFGSTTAWLLGSFIPVRKERTPAPFEALYITVIIATGGLAAIAVLAVLSVGL
jgi:hypothetical protein